MPFWSSKTLLERLPGLIDRFDKDAVDCAAYTLKIGEEVYVSPSVATADPDRISIQKLALGEAFTVPPGQFAFLTSEERVRIPDDVLGLISFKSAVKNRGLVNVSGFHVDPGYSGRLIFAVFNAGPAPVHLKQGDPCFLMWFATLDSDDPKSVRTKPGYVDLPASVITGISGKLESFASLSERIDAVESTHATRMHQIENKLATLQAYYNVARGVLLSLVVGVAVWLVTVVLPARIHPAQLSPEPKGTVTVPRPPAGRAVQPSPLREQPH